MRILLVICVAYYIYRTLLSVICIIKPNSYKCLCFREATGTRPQAYSGREHHLPVCTQRSGCPHRDSEG